MSRTNSNASVNMIVLIGFLLLSGCGQTIYLMQSNPSLLDADVSTVKTVAPPTAPKELFVDAVRWVMVLRNSKSLNAHDPAIRRGYIGKTPFEVEIFFIADGGGALFLPWETRLYLGKNGEPIYPIKVYSGGSSRCGERKKGIPASAHSPVERDMSVPLMNKALVEASQRNYKAYWTCLRLAFDVATPDPSEKFRMRLGGLVTPSQLRIKPMIYFNPITHKVLAN